MNGRENKISLRQFKIPLRLKGKSWNLANLTEALNFTKIKRTCLKSKEINRPRMILDRIEITRNEIYDESWGKEKERREREWSLKWNIKIKRISVRDNLKS